MIDRPPIEPEGMRFVASAVRIGYRPPGVPALLEDGATEIERLRAALTEITSRAARERAKAEHEIRARPPRRLRTNQLRMAYADVIEQIARDAMTSPNETGAE